MGLGRAGVGDGAGQGWGGGWGWASLGGGWGWAGLGQARTVGTHPIHKACQVLGPTPRQQPDMHQGKPTPQAHSAHSPGMCPGPV